MLKKCKKCNENKESDCFYYRKDSKKYKTECKECCREKQRIYLKNNYDDIMLKNKEWRNNNRGVVREIKRRWKRKHPDYIKKENQRRAPKIKAWRTANRERLNEKCCNRRKTDIVFKIKCYLRSRISSALKNNYKSGSAVRDLGCSIEILKRYLEKRFYINKETGQMMTWDNYGKWHIDHKKALALFDLTSKDQFLQACHYTNLQPLWAIDNMSKGARVIEEKANVV